MSLHSWARQCGRSLLLISALILNSFLVSVAQNAWAAPQIQITSKPPFGQNGSITGVVTGVADYQNYDVAAYLYLEGAGWYTKPFFAQPTVSINPDGTFNVNVTTGGNDRLATAYWFDLLPAGSAPQVGAFSHVPVNGSAVASISAERYPQSFNFSGQNWAAKGTYGAAGPGGNYFSANNSDIWVDGAGMHLTMQNHDGHFWATEAILPKHLGYGTYLFETKYDVNALDPNITFGAFTWDPFGLDNRIPAWPYREIDFEDSRFGNAADPKTTQDVVQPFGSNPPHRYTVPNGEVTLTRFFIWHPGSIEFVTLLGDHTQFDYLPQDVLQDWTFLEDVNAGKFVPTPDTEMFHFNMWLNKDMAPSDGQPAEILIPKFSFTPVPEPSTLALLSIAGLMTLAFHFRRSGGAQTLDVLDDCAEGR